jgi:hypothetical protein
VADRLRNLQLIRVIAIVEVLKVPAPPQNTVSDIARLFAELTEIILNLAIVKYDNLQKLKQVIDVPTPTKALAMQVTPSRVSLVVL